MKRLLFCLMALASLTACLKDGTNVKRQYVLEATFQYTGVQFMSDSTYTNTKDLIGFGFDAMNFYHHLNPDKTFAGGFILSCAEMPKSGNTAGLRNTYRANLPTGLTPGNIYTVFHQNQDPALMPEHDIAFAFVENGDCEMAGCFITNTVEVADYVKQNFNVGDRLAVKATGYLNGVKTGEAEMALAEFTEKKDSVVSSWTAFELTKLGAVDCVDFELISTQPDVPAYFCMDSMFATISLEY